jgi:hypothetical protein
VVPYADAARNRKIKVEGLAGPAAQTSRRRAAMPKKVENKKDVPWDALTDVLSKAMAGMPCTNRETVAEKAAAHEWMEKERERYGALRLRNVEKARKAFAEFDAAQALKRGLKP